MSAEVCILSVDTALGACSVALLAGERILARRHVEMDRGHAEVLAPMVDEAMREAQLPFQALERLAVTIGPGTFTGQRVGLAFMRALKVALNIPCLGVTTLAAMAAEAAAETNAEVVVAAHDARRGEVYCGVYQNDGQVLLPPTLLTWRDAADVVARIAGGVRQFELRDVPGAVVGVDIVIAHLRLADRGIGQAAAEHRQRPRLARREQPCARHLLHALGREIGRAHV